MGLIVSSAGVEKSALSRFAGPVERMLLSIKAKDFDQKFDAGTADVVQDLDLITARRPNQRQRRVNVDFPVWLIASLDKEAARILASRPRRTPQRPFD